ncbi:MAG: tetratricopeptide repeat protein [Myxococcota bacterium]
MGGGTAGGPAVALSVALSLALGACQTRGDTVERELEMLRRELAALRADRAERPAPEEQPRRVAARSERPRGSAARRPARSERRATTPPGPPPVARAPDPSAPPPLPVVKLRPKDPFEDGREPTIRIGRNGREAPPVSTRDPNAPLEYHHIDEHGNLVDRDGRIVYKAGTNSPSIDTVPDEESREERLYEDPHESPSAKVARHLRVPRVQRAGDDAWGEDEPVRPGVTPLDEERDRGDAEPSRPRLKQLTIGDPELSPDRDRHVIVQDRPRPDPDEPPVNVKPSRQAGDRAGSEEPPVRMAPPEASPIPEMDAEPAEEAAPMPEPAPAEEGAPAEEEAPSADEPAPTTEEEAPLPEPVSPEIPAAEEPERAPGPQRLIRQKTYRGKKQRRVKRLYERAMEKFRAEDHAGARELFETILVDHSDHDLADNALYWLAETAYSKGKWQQALAWFQDVILRYPEGNKLPDAMLKSALCYARLGDTSYAVQMLTEVETLFSSAPVAEVARERRMALAGGDDG